MNPEYAKIISGSIARGKILGGAGLIGGAMYSSQKAEEQGAPLSEQVSSAFRGGLTPGAVGFGIGAGGYAVKRALKGVLKK